MTEEEYNQRKAAFETHKDTLEKEPSGSDVKKEYWVGCYSKDDWEMIHILLLEDGTLEDNIPNDHVDCPNDCRQSETRAVYLLTDTEVTALKNHPLVKYVHINTAKYPGTYASNPDDIKMDSRVNRYSSTTKHKRDTSTNQSDYLPSSPDSTLLNRGGYNLLRHTAKIDPWYGTNDATVIDSQIPQYATGKGIDLIVCDEDMWFGHIEFMNPSGITDIKQSDNSTAASTAAPANYVGTNVLKAGFATSSTTGICELLDIVLDAPYYIDKEWFEADTGNRLMTRWDGTKVPVESVARSWWSNSSNRSAAFSSAGTVSVPAAYTRANSNGSYTAYHTGSGNHGTPCASQAYGRQYGWAYNANKWFLNLYGTNSVGLEAGFDLQKIFHQNKPVNPDYGNKNPTVSSNSWGLRQSPTTSGYYYFRQGVTGGTGVSYSSRPAFMNYFTGDGLNRRAPEYVDGHAAITAGDEMVEAGVIFVCSAGNNNQKQVQSNHADYNNYYASGSSINYVNATTNSIYSLMNFTPTYNSLNRQGFPAQIGVNRGTTPYTYKTISIGALDDDHAPGGLERKASYSNMGNCTDCFAAADQTLSASDDNSSPRFNRYDAYYDIGTTQAVESEDKNFSGTSSACPIAAGLLATKLENNRTWTYADVKNWLASDVENTTNSYFYEGTEATEFDSSDWGDYYNLQGAQLKIIYDTAPPPAPENPDAKVSVTGSNLSISGNFSIT